MNVTHVWWENSTGPVASGGEPEGTRPGVNSLPGDSTRRKGTASEAELSIAPADPGPGARRMITPLPPMP
jgi:hypothetical protein